MTLSINSSYVNKSEERSHNIAFDRLRVCQGLTSFSLSPLGKISSVKHPYVVGTRSLALLHVVLTSGVTVSWRTVPARPPGHAVFGPCSLSRGPRACRVHSASSHDQKQGTPAALVLHYVKALGERAGRLGGVFAPSRCQNNHKDKVSSVKGTGQWILFFSGYDDGIMGNHPSLCFYNLRKMSC